MENEHGENLPAADPPQHNTNFLIGKSGMAVAYLSGDCCRRWRGYRDSSANDVPSASGRQDDRMDPVVGRTDWFRAGIWRRDRHVADRAEAGRGIRTAGE